MLKPWSKYYPFKDHPILSKFENFLKGIAADEIYFRLLSENVIFMYPRIISISFNPYPIDFKDYDQKYISDDDFRHPYQHKQKIRKEYVASITEYYKFFSYLCEFIKKNKFFPVLIIDLRNANVLYQDFLISIIQEANKNLFNLNFLASEDMSFELRSILPNGFKNLFFSFGSFILAIESYMEEEQNLLKLKVPPALTLESLESLLEEITLNEKAKMKFVVELDFENAKTINTFALCLLAIYIRSISPKFGIRWSFINLSLKSKATEKLIELRTCKINLFFFEKRPPQLLVDRDYSFRSFGLYIFDKNTRHNISYELENFLSSIKNYFFDYLAESVSFTYEFKGRSYQKQKRYLPRITYIQNLIFELIDNIICHANGVGYVAIELSKYLLHIFIGDNGIGFKHGILKNYKLSTEIKDDKDSIKYLFQLDSFNNKRRDVTPSEIGAGYGLKETLYNIYLLNGKFLVRSGNAIGSFVNPVTVSSKPSKIVEYNTFIRGTQYSIMIPLSIVAKNILPTGTNDFFRYKG